MSLKFQNIGQQRLITLIETLENNEKRMILNIKIHLVVKEKICVPSHRGFNENQV